jgi:hypothetical protein
MRFRGWLDRAVQPVCCEKEQRLMERDRTATLQRIIATVQRRWGTRALRVFGEPDIDVIPVISTGFADLDAALHIGGVPRGRLTELLGPIPTFVSPDATGLKRSKGRADRRAFNNIGT